MLRRCELQNKNSKVSLDTIRLAKTGKLGDAFYWVGGVGWCGAAENWAPLSTARDVQILQPSNSVPGQVHPKEIFPQLHQDTQLSMLTTVLSVVTGRWRHLGVLC